MKTIQIPAVACAMFVIGCSHTLPEYTAKSIPPPQYSAPAGTAVHTPPSQLPESALPVTLVIDLTPLEQALRTTMPEHFSEAGHPLRTDYRWDFVREAVPQCLMPSWPNRCKTYSFTKNSPSVD